MSDMVLLAAKHEVARSPEPELTRGEVAVGSETTTLSTPPYKDYLGAEMVMARTHTNRGYGPNVRTS